MSVYLDTSVLVSVLTNEATTPRVNAWLGAQTPGTLFISEWTHTEIANALSLKMRTGEITLALRAAATAGFTTLASSSLPTLAVLSNHFEVAAHLAGQQQLALRAGDALHLAIARDNGHSVATFDQRMADAALQIGVPVEAL